MDKYYFNKIKELLIKNGFHEVKEYQYSNDLCTVRIMLDENNIRSFYAISDEEGSMYSATLDIYWLVGVLVYKDYIEKFEKL